MNKELTWNDIAYFSKGLLSVDSTTGLTISTNTPLSVNQFIKALLDAGAEAEMTLNALRLPADRMNNFPVPAPTPLLFNANERNYTKTVNHVFTHQQILTQAEVEA